MKVEVSVGIEELKTQFGSATFVVREDGQGGAYVVLDPIVLGPNFSPLSTWLGFQIPAQYPYSDIYPVFIGADVTRADGIPFSPPVTPGHQFEGRAALQVSRRNAAAPTSGQKVTAKILKVLDFLASLS